MLTIIQILILCWLMNPLTAHLPSRWTQVGKRYLIGTNGYATFRCVCGNERDICIANVKLGKSKSCGCLRSVVLSENATTHGHARRDASRREKKSLGIYFGMWSRCNNPKNHAFHNYGGRGITVCDRWNDYEAFVADMGLPPNSNSTIERIDVNGNYEPNNCKWMPLRDQSCNTRGSLFVTLGGEKLCLKRAAAKVGIPYHKAYYRFKGRQTIGGGIEYFS